MIKSLVLSCEHAGNEPNAYSFLFKANRDVLNTHRGWDLGAWELAQFLSMELNAPLHGCHTTRLLIEANRSLDSPQLFSEYSSSLPDSEKEKLIETIYKPYRRTIRKNITVTTKPVLHLSIHSFTPIWNDVERPVDIGILFDPHQTLERIISLKLKEALETLLPNKQIKFNEPYKGTDDGFTTELRTQFPTDEYAGIELEVNQKYASDLSSIQHEITQALKEVLK